MVPSTPRRMHMVCVEGYSKSWWQPSIWFPPNSDWGAVTRRWQVPPSLNQAGFLNLLQPFFSCFFDVRVWDTSYIPSAAILSSWGLCETNSSHLQMVRTKYDSVCFLQTNLSLRKLHGLTFFLQTEVIHGLIRFCSRSKISLRLSSFWMRPYGLVSLPVWNSLSPLHTNVSLAAGENFVMWQHYIHYGVFLGNAHGWWVK